MKWQVCSCGDLAGTEVLGVVEADTELEASQLANEKFRPSYKGEDILVRPLREDGKGVAGRSIVVSTTIQELNNAAYHQEPTEIEGPDIYEFTADKNEWNELGKDRLFITIERDHLYELLMELLSDGLGREHEKFEFRLCGRLNKSEL